MTKRYSLQLRGRTREWAFGIDAQPQDVEEWRADGLEVYEVHNTIPQWYYDLGLPIGLWCWLQDIGVVRL